MFLKPQAKVTHMNYNATGLMRSQTQDMLDSKHRGDTTHLGLINEWVSYTAMRIL
jgi:hypothetical protein